MCNRSSNAFSSAFSLARIFSVLCFLSVSSWVSCERNAMTCTVNRRLLSTKHPGNYLKHPDLLHTRMNRWKKTCSCWIERSSPQTFMWSSNSYYLRYLLVAYSWQGCAILCFGYIFCNSYQQNKAHHSAKQHFMVPLPVPQRPFLITGVGFYHKTADNYDGFRCKLCHFYHFTKLVHFIPYHSNIAAQKMIRCFENTLCVTMVYLCIRLALSYIYDVRVIV